MSENEFDFKDEQPEEQQFEKPESPESESESPEPEFKVPKVGGFMAAPIPTQPWEKEIEGDINVEGGPGTYRSENGRELHGVDSERAGIERTTDGRKTVEDILTRSLGGRGYDPNRIMIFPDQERGKGTGTQYSIRHPAEWNIVIEAMVAACPEFDGQRSNVYRHCLIQGMLHFGFQGLVNLGAIEAKRKLGQKKVELETCQALLKDAEETFAGYVEAEDREGFMEAAEEFKEGLGGLPEVWRKRAQEIVKKWEARVKE